MTAFYEEVENYYDSDAHDFDRRYWNNKTLQLIRQDFREQLKRFRFTHMLEIGYGTGLDMIHFAKTHPDANIAGIDIAANMQQITEAKIRQEGLENVVALKGGVEDLPKLFPGHKFDMIYVYFGALNTVEDLSLAAKVLIRMTKPGGIMILSFVNKYYVAGMLIELLKLRPKAAFSRLRKVWGGYSPTVYLPSRCYSPKEIRHAFGSCNILLKKGYCIFHPAWYYHGLNSLLRRFSRLLWKIDMFINKTPMWSLGEYTLFAFQRPDDISQ